MTHPLVSIITPCWNGEKYVKRFLESVLAQTYPNLELIFINDGSTDQTEQIVQSYTERLREKNIRFIYQYQKNAGQAAALNRGLKLFSGDYLLCMDSDDGMSDNFVESRVNFLQNNPEYVYCYGRAEFVNENVPESERKATKWRGTKERHQFFEDILFNVRDVFFPGYLILTEALDKTIANRDIYAGRGGQNAQVLLPLAWFYGEPGYVEDSTYFYILHDDSHSHSVNSSRKEIAQLHDYEKILVETIKRIGDVKAAEYIKSVNCYYAKLRFGNAVDTKDAELIDQYFTAVKCLGVATLHDRLLYLKYANPVLRYCKRRSTGKGE